LMEGPAAKTADRPVAARAGKTPWLVTVLKAYDGRSAIEATMEPCKTGTRYQHSLHASPHGTESVRGASGTWIGRWLLRLVLDSVVS